MADIKISALPAAPTFNTTSKATGLEAGANVTWTGAVIEAFINRTGGSVYTSLFAKAPLASPAFTGVPTAPTAAPGTNTTQIATTAFVLANGGGSAITVQDEGSALTTAATTLNFTGAGVTASGTGGVKTINIPGGAGVSDYGDLSDATTVNLPVVNVPLQNALADKAAIGERTLLVGTTWDLDSQPFAEKPISANVTITVTGGTAAVTTGFLVLHVTGSGITATVDGKTFLLEDDDSTAISIIKNIDGSYHKSPDYWPGGGGIPTLSAPTYSAATAGSTSINLTSISYDPASTSMVIRRATDPGMTAGLTTLLSGAPVTSYADGGLTPSSTYYYEIYTSASGYYNSPATQHSGTTASSGATTLTTPGSFTAGTPTSGGVPSSWTDLNSSPNELGFEIQITLASDTTFASVVQTRTPATDATSDPGGTGLAPTTAYIMRLRALGNSTTILHSAWTSSVPFTTAASTFDPLTIPNLAVWLEKDNGYTVVDDSGTDRVTVWADQSVNGNDASYTSLMGIGTAPKLDAANDNAVLFDSLAANTTGSKFHIPSLDLSTTEDVTIYMAIDLLDSTTSPQIIFMHGDSDPSSAGSGGFNSAVYGGAAQVNSADWSPSTNTTNFGATRYFTVGSTMILRVEIWRTEPGASQTTTYFDGVTVNDKLGAANNTAGTHAVKPLYIGGSFNDDSKCAMRLREVIIVAGQPTSTVNDDIEAYLAANNGV